MNNGPIVQVRVFCSVSHDKVWSKSLYQNRPRIIDLFKSQTKTVCMAILIPKNCWQYNVLAAITPIMHCLVLPPLDYAELVWSNKRNDMLIEKLQILQNKVAKVILDSPCMVFLCLICYTWVRIGSYRNLYQIAGKTITLYKFYNLLF
jgi:hypothetical protein